MSSVSVTYFIGTSRWCKEVVEAYGLDEELAAQSLRLKRQSFPWSFVAICTILVLASFAGAANPSVRLQEAAAWFIPYRVMAVVGTVLVAVSFWKQSGYLEDNYQVIQQIVAKVKEIRDQHG